MSKQCKHWNDKNYQKKENQFNIFLLASEITNTLTNWSLHDFTITENMNTYEIDLQRARARKITDYAESIEAVIADADSIYALYPCDWEERRKRWIQARGLCSRLTVILTHISNYVAKDTNIQKYVNIQSKVNLLAANIKKIMISDDKKRESAILNN